jgi:hypothetical protein
MYALKTDFLFDCHTKQTYDLRDEILRSMYHIVWSFMDSWPEIASRL